MEIILKEGSTHILRFDFDEEVLSGIIKYCKKYNVVGGWLSMLGACKEVELFFYDPKTRIYNPKKTFKDALEVTGATGNVGRKGKDCIVHVHGTFSDKKYKVIGGHINSLVASATIEVRLDVFKGEINRARDKRTGLNLMCSL